MKHVRYTTPYAHWPHAEESVADFVKDELSSEPLVRGEVEELRALTERQAAAIGIIFQKLADMGQIQPGDLVQVSSSAGNIELFDN